MGASGARGVTKTESTDPPEFRGESRAAECGVVVADAGTSVAVLSAVGPRRDNLRPGAEMPSVAKRDSCDTSASNACDTTEARLRESRGDTVSGNGGSRGDLRCLEGRNRSPAAEARLPALVVSNSASPAVLACVLARRCRGKFGSDETTGRAGFKAAKEDDDRESPTDTAESSRKLSTTGEESECRRAGTRPHAITSRNVTPTSGL